jgi:hypothetical protein
MAVALVAAGMLFTPWLGTAQEEGLPAETLAQSTPFYGLRWQGNNPAVIFTRSGSGGEHDPRIFLFTRDGWRLIQLPESFHNTSWVYAGRAADSGELWGITEGASADGKSYLYLAASERNGRSWRLRGTLEKVSRHAVVDTLAMNKAGKGTLILRLDEDPSPEAPRLGYYVYMTKNGGREWSTPMFSSGKPLSPSDRLPPPDRTFDAQQPLDAAAWQAALVEMQPPAE